MMMMMMMMMLYNDVEYDDDDDGINVCDNLDDCNDVCAVMMPVMMMMIFV